MVDIFLEIVNMSISASWLVLAVLALRLILKKAPKWIRVLLWGIVAVRLVCPFSIESALSLIPSGETIPENILSGPSFDIQTGIGVVDNRVNDYLDDRYFEGVTVPENNGLNVMTVLTVIWAIGIAALLAYTFISYYRLRKQVATAVRFRENIYLSENVASPFVLGIVKPRIYLPFTINEGDMALVIAHEQTHIRRKDHWWKPIGFLLLTVYWINPLMWVAYVLLCRDIELACDEKVIRELGTEQRADYSQALLSCSVSRRSIAACPLAFGEAGVKERVKNVLNYRKPAFWIVLISVILCVVVAVTMLTDPVPAATPDEVFSTLSVDKIQWVQATIWGKTTEETVHIMLDGGEIEELVGILKSIESDEYEENGSKGLGISFFIQAGEREINLSYSEGYVAMSWDSDTAWFVDNIAWRVRNEELIRFMLAHTLCGTYVFTDTAEDQEWNVSSLQLLEDGTFEFSFSPISSYWGHGTYEVSDRQVVLRTDDGRFHYTFNIDGYHLMLNAGASSKQLWFSGLYDGAYMLRKGIVRTLVDEDVYVSSSCQYMNLLSSFIGWGGDSEELYLIGEDSFTIQTRKYGSTTFENIRWGWQEMPWSDTDISGMFSSLGMLKLLKDQGNVLYQPISNNYFIMSVNGTLMLVKHHRDEVWSIYTIVPQSSMGSAQWEFEPTSSAGYPGFEIGFDLDCTSYQVFTLNGVLSDGETQADMLDISQGDTLCWLPVDSDGNIVTDAVIRFTGYQGEIIVSQGTIYVSSQRNGDVGGRIYTATVIGSGFYIVQNGENGALITAEKS